MDINETLEYIHDVKWQGSKPGLSRTRELLDRLGNPQKELTFIHVAGTNGKGSTCAMMASVLQQAGYITGLYTSPYIMSFNERIQVNGRHISDNELIKYIEEIKPHADAMEDSPTEFEIITALAMRYFYIYGCNIVLLEVGMGGELDSTNVIDTPELAVITAIDYDHVQQLGKTLSEITKAKAGIIKPNGDVLAYGGNAEVEEVLKNAADERGARLYKIVNERITKVKVSLASTRLVIEPYEEIHLPLAGVYQPYNALLAVTALEMLCDKGYRITPDNIVDGLTAVKWPGRFEFLGYDPVFILDGAHNPHGVKAAVDSLKAYFGDRKFIFIMGVLSDKDVKSMIAHIAPVAEHVFVIEPNSPRMMHVKELADMITGLGVPAVACSSIIDGVESAIEMAGSSGTRGVICALGSLYMSADVRYAYETYMK